jgi:hypothetical protein
MVYNPIERKTKEVFMGYIEDMKIDENGIDVEWLRQPRLMMQYSEEAAKARRDCDRAKEALDICKAELARDIRSSPETFGLAKITDSAVESTILNQNEYKTCMEDFIQAKYNMEMAQAAVRAMDQKKTALENLVRLFGMQYFAGPSVPRDLSVEWEKTQDKRETVANAGVAKSMQRRGK